MRSKSFLLGLIAVFYLLFGANLQAQQSYGGCGLSTYMEKLIAQHPEMLTQLEQFQNYQRNYIERKKAAKTTSLDTAKIIIPIVFHIIHNYGSENISDAQILNEMDTLNRDYQKRNRDTIQVEAPFNKIIANCNFEWRLAQIDPNGKPTTGIERIPSVKTYAAGEGSKINQWPREKYMNVWVVSSIASGDGLSGGTILGYAPFPSSADGYYAPSDGVLLHNIAVGSIGTAGGNLASYPSQLARTLTHELGHTMSLLHTWGPTNSPGVACGDDGIADTPPTMGHTNCGNPTDGFCGADTLINVMRFTKVTALTGSVDSATALPTNVSNAFLTQLFSFTPFSAVGVGSASQVNGQFAFAKWDTGFVVNGNLNPSKYYQVTLSPAYGYSSELLNISFTFARNKTGVTSFAVRSSIDGFASNLKATSGDNNQVTIGGDNSFNVVNDTTGPVVCSVATSSYLNVPITLRIYGWNAVDSTGLFVLDSVAFKNATGLTENIQNYMEYSTCQKMFTLDQAMAMRATLESSVSQRNNLPTQANLLATGTSDPYVYAPTANPVADFHSGSNLGNTNPTYTTPDPTLLTACKGKTVYFFNDSWGATKFDSAHWIFPNGTPASKTTNGTPSYDTVYRNYIPVSFNSAGPQAVSLTVYADTGKVGNKGVVSSTITKTILINDSTAPMISQMVGSHYYESFEDTAEFRKNWIVNNVTNNNTFWAVTNKASSSGYNSVELNSFWTPTLQMPFDNNIGDVDELISPTLNLDTFAAAPIYLTFKYAYATRSFSPSQVLDFFNIWYSTTCGETWYKLGTLTPKNDSIAKKNGATNGAYSYLGDPSFANAGIDGNAFTPNNSTEWRQVGFLLTNPASVHPAPLTKDELKSIRFKFKYQSCFNSNNLYLDDITFGNSNVGIQNVNADLNALRVYPNPAIATANITYQLANRQMINVSVYDVVGNRITTLVSQIQEQGDYHLSISTNELKAGIYFVRLTSDSKATSIQKFILIN